MDISQLETLLGDKISEETQFVPVRQFPQKVYPRIWEVDKTVLVMGQNNRSFYDFRTAKLFRKLPEEVGSAGDNIKEYNLFKSEDRSRLYDIRTGEVIAQIPDKIRAVFRHSGELRLLGADNKTLYNKKGGIVLKFPQKVHWTAYDVDKGILIHSSDDGKILYDLTGKVALTLPKASCSSCVQDTDGKLLVMDDGGYTYMDLRTGKVVFSLAHGSNGLIVKVKDEYWVQGGWLCQRSFYNLKTGKEEVKFPQEIDDVYYVDNRPIVLAKDMATFYDLETGELDFRLDESVYTNGCNIGGRTLLRTESNGYLDLETWQVVFKMPKKVNPWLFEVDGQILAWGRDNRTLYSARREKRIDCTLDELSAVLK